MIELLVAPISALLSKVIPDKDERNRLAHEIATMAERQAHEQIIAQVEVNKQEATHPSIFVSGWRPFIGWTCGFAMAFNFIGVPLISTATILYGNPVVLVPLDLEVMLPVLLGMLGLGGMRSYERRNGVVRVK